MILAHVAVWDPYEPAMIHHKLPGLDLYSTDPAPPLTTAGEESYDIDDLSDLCEVPKDSAAQPKRKLPKKKTHAPTLTESKTSACS